MNADVPRHSATTPAGLGALLRDLRLRQGMTQAQVAQQAGVSRAWLIRAEEGSPRIEVSRVFSVLRALGFQLHVSPVETEPADSPVAQYLDDLLGG